MVAEIAARVEHPLRPEELRRDLRLSRERMARLVDVSAKTVERWEHQQSLSPRTSSRIRVQLAQIQEVRDLGLCVYTKADEVIAALAADYEGLGY
jgi:DNA-binding XRE family transcriptional regulator